MSWEVFKQNILNKVSSGIADTDTVASIYAEEYHNAIKRGYDKINHIPVQDSTGIDKMKNFFKAALERGLSSKEPYDLIGNMGDGVIAYWMGVQMNQTIIPPTPAPTSVSNLSVVKHSIVDFGQWQGALPSAGQLTEVRKEEIKEELKYYNKQLQKDPTNGATQAIIRTNLGALENNHEFSVDANSLGASFDETEAAYPPVTFLKGTKFPPIHSNGGFDSPWTPPTFEPDDTLGMKIVKAAKADVGVAMETDGVDDGPRIRQILAHVGITHPDAWCASAVTSWWDSAGAPRMPAIENPAWVPNWIAWGKKNNQWSDKPAIGAAVIYDWDGGGEQWGDHIGIVSMIKSDGSIVAIEGNTSGPKGGGCYEKVPWNPKRIIGYVWPKANLLAPPKDVGIKINKNFTDSDQYTIKGALKPK
jgi:hypothetical protein